MRTRSARRGATLLELSAYLALSSALLVTLGSLELLARRATFHQVATLDGLDSVKRAMARMEEDLGGRLVSRVEVQDGEIRIVPAPGPEAAAEILYQRTPASEIARIARAPDGKEDRDVVSRHVEAFEVAIEAKAGSPVLVSWSISIHRKVPNGHPYRRKFSGAVIAVGAKP